jgi:ketosteroid isomerase-like protein
MVEYTAPVFWGFFLLTGIALFVLRITRGTIRAMRFALAWFLAFSACGSGAPQQPVAPVPAPAPAPAATSTELSPELASLGWWLGAWQAIDGSSREHWIAAGGAIYGISLHRGGGFEALIVDDGDSPGKADGVLRLIAMPGGQRAVEFRQRLIEESSATFANDAHDFPKTVTYRRAGDELQAILGGSDRSERFAFRRHVAAAAPELEAADVAFSAATGDRGAEGWVAAFDPEGWMLRQGEKVVGHDAIAALMRPALAGGRMSWAPLASGRAGDLGFTVGKASFTGATAETSWRSSYVTIWRRQSDGTWKVLFDTGRIIHE